MLHIKRGGKGLHHAIRNYLQEQRYRIAQAVTDRQLKLMGSQEICINLSLITYGWPTYLEQGVPDLIQNATRQW